MSFCESPCLRYLPRRSPAGASFFATGRTGALLRPELSPDQAGRWLANALDGARPEKLSPEQVAFLVQQGRRQGCHTAMLWLAREAGYSDPQPVEPEDEMAALLRQYIEAAKVIKTIAERIERVQLRTVEGM